MAGKNIKLKDRSGAAIDYAEVSKIQIPAADGSGDITYQLPSNMQEKDVTITANGDTRVTPDDGYDGLTRVDVTVAVPVPEIQTAETDLSMWRGNQTITAPTGAAYSMVTIRKPDTFIEPNIKYGVTIGGVKGTYEGLPQQSKFVDLNMKIGNQTIAPDTGYVMSSAQIKKPSTMLPENIKKNVNIGGVVGTLEGAKTEESPTVDLDMSSGNQTILPLVNGNVMTEVTVTKPDTFIPSNIKKDVSIGGVVGTYEAGGTEEQTKTVDLSMADGDQVVTPDAGKTLSQVTITKPATMIPGNIKKDVDIGGVVGTLDTGGGGADISNWGDADGNGSYVYWPNNSGITVYGKGETIGTQDLNYAYCLYGNPFSITTESPLNALNSWAANVMTAGTAENTAFNKAFNSDNQSLFLGRYLSGKPEFLSSDTKDWNGLKSALYRALGDFKKTHDGWWASPYISNYVNGFDGDGYYDATKQSFGFWWGLPSSSAMTEPYCKLQTPNGTMPTYSSGFEQLNFPGVLGVGIFINQNAGGAGNTSEFVLMIIDTMIVLYSPVAQTIPAALVNLIFQVEIELPVEAGWSYLDRQTLTAVSTTIDYLTDASLSEYGLYLGNLPYSVLSGLNDDYQRSFFQTNTRNALSSVAYKWGVEFNISKATT